MKMQAGGKLTGETSGKPFHAAADVLRLDQVEPGNVHQAAPEAIPGFLLPRLWPVAVQEAKRGRSGAGHHITLREAAALYARATGEAPHEVVAAGRAVLIETQVAGSYEHFPNGYVPILISRTACGWVVFDTGQTALKADFAHDAVLRDANRLYVKTGSKPEEVRRGIRTMVGVLRKLNEGR